MYKSFKDKLKTKKVLEENKKKQETKNDISINEILNEPKETQSKIIPNFDIDKELCSGKNQGFLSLETIKEINVTED